MNEPPRPEADDSSGPAVFTPVTVEREGSVATLTLTASARHGGRADRELLQALDDVLGELERERGLTRVLVRSEASGLFLSGIPIASYDELLEGDRAERFAAGGQRVLARLASLAVPTVAVLEGHCLGGGLELALACSMRIASSSGVVQLGFPEGLLGLVPPWGGVRRLGALVGPSLALEILGTGAALSAQRALELGLIDALAPAESLLDEALLVQPRRRSWLLMDRMLRSMPFLRPLAFRQLGRRQARLAPDPDAYPAPARTLRLVELSMFWSEEELAPVEREAFVETLSSAGSRHLRAGLLARARVGRAALERLGANERPVATLDLGPGIVSTALAARARGATLAEGSPAALHAALVDAADLVEDHARDDAALVLVQLADRPLAELSRGDARTVGFRLALSGPEPRLTELVVLPETDPRLASSALELLRAMGLLVVLAGDGRLGVVERVLGALTDAIDGERAAGGSPRELADALALEGFRPAEYGLPEGKPERGDPARGAALLAALADEAERVLEEGLVADAETLDFMLVHGGGFPAWRGGPLAARRETQRDAGD